MIFVIIPKEKITFGIKKKTVFKIWRRPIIIVSRKHNLKKIDKKFYLEKKRYVYWSKIISSQIKEKINFPWKIHIIVYMILKSKDFKWEKRNNRKILIKRLIVIWKRKIFEGRAKIEIK